MESLTPGLAVLLIALGLLLLFSEVFFPSGLLLLFALLAIVAGVVLPFCYGELASGVVTLITTVLVLFGAVVWIRHYWRSVGSRRLVLPGPEDDVTVASMPVLVELEQLRGRVGKALSPLRPAGTADFDGRRIDVLTEGIMVEPGRAVRCVDVRAGRVIVRPVEAGPQLAELENVDFS